MQKGETLRNQETRRAHLLAALEADDVGADSGEHAVELNG